MQQNTSSLSRRKVTTGIAWSVPAVVAVAAAPFAAASPSCITSSAGRVVKYPGNSSGYDLKQAYGFTVTVTNPTRGKLRVTAKSVSLILDKKVLRGSLLIYTADPCAGGVPVDPNSDLLVLEPGESQTLFLVANNTGNSANTSGCIYAKLGVKLVDGSVPVANLCDEHDVVEACFDETSPTATC
ncbi:hypothetical protein FDF08_11990 [Micrococcus luteus]|nr:hypothetical protein FDF08_11990 [Micrococcus luteus]